MIGIILWIIMTLMVAVEVFEPVSLYHPLNYHIALATVWIIASICFFVLIRIKPIS